VFALTNSCEPQLSARDGISFSVGSLTRIVTVGSLVLIATAFFLDIAGNRWGSYIRTPIPGIFLPDLLLILAFFGSLVHWRDLRLFALWVKLTYGVLWLYVIAILITEMPRIPADDRYLALRDNSPFLFLAIVPILALSLQFANSRLTINFVRFATLLAAVGPLLLHLGFLFQFSSPLLGSDFVKVFEYRTDLTGAAIAIGMVAWSGWPSIHLRSQLSAQIFLVLVAGLTVSSRSGLLAVLSGIVVIGFLGQRGVRGLLISMLCALTLIGGIAVSPTLSQLGNTQTPPDISVSDQPTADEVDTVTTQAEPLAAVRSLTRGGTVGARLDTWNDVIQGLTRDRSWLLGGAAGSDYLYELCTGIEVAPIEVRIENNDPTCAVDDYGPNPVVRDPHNWVLNIILTHGLFGFLAFSLVLGVTLFRGRGSEGYTLAGWTIGFFLVTGSTFLISGGYALLPMSVAAAWIVSGVGFKRTSSDS